MREERWYLCELTLLEVEEPDWSKIPEARREMVRAQWIARQAIAPQRVKLWGPQIHIFERFALGGVRILDKEGA